MNDPIRMRLRSGAVIDPRSRSEAPEEPNEDMDRQEDSLSTAATWGTPLTASQSTLDSRSSQPERTGSSSSQQAQSSQRDEPIYVPTEAPRDADSRAVEAPVNHGNGHASSSAQGPTPSRRLPPLPSQQTQPDMLRRFSTESGPWHASPTMIPGDAESSKRRLSEVEGMENYQLDRTYPDKMEAELAEMEQGGVEGNERGHDSKKRKTTRRSKKQGDEKVRSKGKDGRDDSGDGDGDDDGDGAEGMVAH